jgi:hypothetical protein
MTRTAERCAAGCDAQQDEKDTITTEETHAVYAAALETAAELLGARLEPFVEPGPGEPGNAGDFTRLATVHTFGDAWQRTDVHPDRCARRRRARFRQLPNRS